MALVTRTVLGLLAWLAVRAGSNVDLAIPAAVAMGPNNRVLPNRAGRLVPVPDDPETGRSMDDAQLADNLLTFYLAGHETTAKALTWSLYLLSQSPQFRDMIERELDDMVGEHPLTLDLVERLPFAGGRQHYLVLRKP